MVLHCPSGQRVILSITLLYLPTTTKLYAHETADDIDDVATVNSATDAEARTISASFSVQVFSPDGLHLYGAGLGGVGVIVTTTDVPTIAIVSIPNATGVAITPDGLHLYITDVATQSVLVADTATYTISAVLPLSVDGNIDETNGRGAIVIVAPH